MSIQRVRFGSSVLAGSTRFALKQSGKTALHIERLGLLEPVVAGPRELVRQCLGG